MLAGFLVCLFVGLLIIFLGYQIHVKKKEVVFVSRISRRNVCWRQK